MPLAHSEHPMARRAGGAAVQLPFFLQQNLARTGLDLQRRYSPARFIPHRRDAARDAVKDRPAPFHVGSQPTNASSRGNRLGYRFCLPFDTDCLLSTLPVVLSCPSSDVYTTPVTIQHVWWLTSQPTIRALSALRFHLSPVHPRQLALRPVRHILQRSNETLTHPALL
ncbi:hypothetical protein CMEL01_01117 [Colletotrichum melonis]|uniref:Uncharacterized protein n=3 Tax=Colletotrichum acutatum species complex TaxID=2707335 RepID=A0AAI9XZY3_9PEZI|nr:uncharacterized protein CTAM01_04046 [Colletotrichum tamarilloi]KAK1448308.1 hypothetical protein CCUS01_11716 [Colletotrichum cuscutae]KAK1469350.1 hypothetical protein CMEL01_01117 [Colletotrichum melonis]KAK1504739.1 hypothetical protein CTAM01_04046 [Colletotrichum tamarilloi]